MNEDESSPRPADLQPGFDENDPYEGGNLDEYPDWWRSMIVEFREYGLRPYRPPKFNDEEIVNNIVSSLEERYDVNIRIRKLNPSIGEDWDIWINDKRIGQIGRKRNEEGRTIYMMDSGKFEHIVENACGDQN